MRGGMVQMEGGSATNLFKFLNTSEHIFLFIFTKMHKCLIYNLCCVYVDIESIIMRVLYASLFHHVRIHRVPMIMLLSFK